jgi:menaquinone-9 beta-reductase
MHFIPTEKYDADVLVVGGGPAGASCAFHLAAAGFRVIVIDFAQFPRDKVCGDFVGPVAIRELEAMGIANDPSFQQTNIIRKAAVYLDGVNLLTKEIPAIAGLPDHGRVIPRETLDHWILEKAKSRGVRVITSCKFQRSETFSNAVTSYCKGPEGEVSFTTRFLVGADGSNSTLARQLNGAKPDAECRIIAVRAYYTNVDCTADEAELYFTSKSFPGYYWFFPTGPGAANVGIGMVVENFPAEEVNLKRLLEDLIENDATLKKKMANARLQGKIVGWPLSTYNPKAEIAAHRVLLTGDAAGLINSLNGEGIQYALLSGRWAAEALIPCLNRQEYSKALLFDYIQKIKARLGLDMSVSNLVIQVIRNRNLTSLWLQLLSIMSERAAADEQYANVAGGILAGLIPSQAALSPSFIGKSVQQVFSSVLKQTVAETRKNPLALPATGIRFAGYTLAQLGNVVQQREQYWQWSKGIAEKGMLVSKHLLRSVICPD